MDAEEPVIQEWCESDASAPDAQTTSVARAGQRAADGAPTQSLAPTDSPDAQTTSVARAAQRPADGAPAIFVFGSTYAAEETDVAHAAQAAFDALAQVYDLETGGLMWLDSVNNLG